MLALALSLSVGYTFAEGGLGVQVIGEDSGMVQSVSLDDIKVGSSYKIAGYVTVAPISFEHVDFLAQYNAGKGGDNATERKNSNDPALVFTAKRQARFIPT